MPHWPPYYPNSGRILEILEILDNPQLNLPPVIHVAGTNGKGSTICFMKQIAAEHKIKFCSFTSPHLLNFNENLIVNNAEITDDVIYRLTEEIRLKLGGNFQPSFFEYQTALAFLAFSRSGADICFIECGMGAKNDPTNIIPSPLISILTPISLDHQEFLGESLAEITLDKCHIIKNAPVISSAQKPEAQIIINKFCQLQKVPLSSYEINYDYDVEKDKLIYIDLKTKEMIYYNLPKLVGAHQIQNLATAIASLKRQELFKIDDEKVNIAITKAKWPGRIEPIYSQYDNLEIWFDGAHNEAGAENLSKWINKQTNKTTIMIYGRTKGSNHKAFLKHFLKQDLNINFVTVKNEPSPETRHSFKNFQNNNPEFNAINIESDLEELFLQKILPNKNQQRIIICGSLYLYRDLHKFLN